MHIGTHLVVGAVEIKTATYLLIVGRDIYWKAAQGLDAGFAFNVVQVSKLFFYFKFKLLVQFLNCLLMG